MGKTEIIVVGKHKNISQDLKQSFKCTTSIKYLGCVISDDKQRIYKENFISSLNNMKSELSKWMNLPINLTGRINVFKVTWLPKFLFLFSTVPITPPKVFFKKAYSIITDFIWANKNHRVKRKVLHLPKSEGGFNLPDLELYHLATQAFYLRHVVKNTIAEQWIHFENAQVYPQNLFTYIFSKDANISSANFIVRNLNLPLSWSTWKDRGIET